MLDFFNEFLSFQISQNPGTVGTYNPFESAAGKMVLRTKIGLSKAQKKKWHQEERKRFQELEALGPLKLDQRVNPPRHEKVI